MILNLRFLILILLILIPLARLQYDDLQNNLISKSRFLLPKIKGFLNGMLLKENEGSPLSVPELLGSQVP